MGAWLAGRLPGAREIRISYSGGGFYMAGHANSPAARIHRTG